MSAIVKPPTREQQAQRIAWLEIEVERLKADLRNLDELYSQRVAEIGRLREVFQEAVGEVEARDAEIERLKAALQDALTAWQENRNLNEDQMRAALEGK